MDSLAKQLPYYLTSLSLEHYVPSGGESGLSDNLMAILDGMATEPGLDRIEELSARVGLQYANEPWEFDTYMASVIVF